MREILNILFFFLCVILLILLIMLGVTAIVTIIVKWKELIDDWREDNDRY